MNESEPIVVVIEPAAKPEPLERVELVIEGEPKREPVRYRLVGDTLVPVESTD